MNLTNAVSPYLAFSENKEFIIGEDQYTKGCIPNDPISGVRIVPSSMGYLIIDPRGFSYISSDNSIFSTTTIVDGYILDDVVHSRYKDTKSLGGPVLYGSPLYHTLKLNSNKRIRINTIPRWTRVKFDSQDTGYLIGAEYIDLRNTYMDFQLGRIKNEYTIVVGKRGQWEIRSVRKANKIVSKDETDMFPEASSYEPYICKYKEGMTFKLPIEVQITNIPYKNSRDTLPIDPTTNLIYFYNSTTRRYEGYDKWNTEYISQSLYYPTTKHLFSGQTPLDSTDRPPANCNSVIIDHGPAIVL